jgi:hypothetical protein
LPFANYVARNFSTISVQGYAPPVSGVYGLSSAREWIVIGETDDIQAKLLQLLQDQSSPVGVRKPTGFTFEICPGPSRVTRMNALVQELSPVCNRAESPAARGRF